MKNKIDNQLQMDLQPMIFDIQQELTYKVCQELNNQLENYIVEGLKIKGFDFKDRSELEVIISNNCKCEDNIEKKERTYFVNDVPFFLHKYEIEMINPVTLDASFQMTANFGSYAYL